MRRPKWVFQTTPKMGGATGEAYVNPLQGVGMPAAAVLAREAVQNSVDACEGHGKVRVDFRRVTVKGEEKAAFVKALALRPAVSDRRSVLQLPTHHCLERLTDPSIPIPLLFIEDHGTHGLFGAPHDAGSHFFRLLLSLGDGSKARHAEGSGGSFGYGKSVYSSNSRIRTVVAYTVFDPAHSGTRKRDEHARLMACGYFNSHTIEKQSFTGRAWLGLESTTEPEIVGPLVNADAHALAENLRFRPRAEDDLGTSLLVVDCGVDCEELREAIEEWWWPRLLEDNLDIALYEGDKRLPPPRPKKRKDLVPFIDAYELAIGRSMPTGKHQKADQFQKLHGRPIGRYGLVAIDDDPDAETKLMERLDSVALIRGPRMVVEYLPVRVGSTTRYAGVCIAAPEIEKELRLSEPPEHTRWDPDSSRLETLGDEAREFVQAITSRVKQRVRAFVNEAAPPKPRQELHLRSLERLLGGIFRAPSKGPDRPPGPISQADPVEIRLLEPPHTIADGDELRLQGVLRIGLADGSDRDSIEARLRVRCLVQEDEGVADDDSIPVHLEGDDADFEHDPENPGAVLVTLTRDWKPSFRYRSEPYSPDWTTRVEVEVEEV